MRARTSTRTGRRTAVAAALVALALAALPAAGTPAAAQPAPAAQEPGPGADAVVAQDSPVPAPPEPAPAAAEDLPLEAAGQASPEELAAPPRADQAQDQVRDLPDRGEPLPASATTFSSPAAGAARTLVLYDTTGPYAQLGEYYALGMGMLASHAGTVTAVPVGDYTDGMAGSYTAVIYTGSTYDQALPQALVHDVLTGDVPVIWSGFNIWQLAATPQDRATFAARYGWDAATSYIDTADQVTSVTYGGQALSRNALNTGGILAPNVTEPDRLTVLGTATCSDAGGQARTCAPIAQSQGTSFPWAVRSGNLTYIGEVPLSYLSESDRYLAAADIVLDTLVPDATPVRQAAVRIEDVTPSVSGAAMRDYVDYLAGAGVPFQVAVVPEYVDPDGVYNDGSPEHYTLADNPELVEALRYATEHGGTLVQHGTTHQYSGLDNPYNQVSGDDFEFIRSWCTATNDRQAPPVPCANDRWVQAGGELPGTGTAWAAERIASGRQIFAQVGLPTPTVFETPHYAASAPAYQGMSQVYQTRYERMILHAGLLTGRAGGAFDYYGQFFPYTVYDPYGARVLPENLGNVELEAYNNHPPRLPADIVASARANLVVTHATASFFFHPFYDVSLLRQVVEGIQAQGYTFVPATGLT